MLDSTATESSELDEQVRESMLERVRNIANREQIRGALHDLLSQKASYVGEISRISEEAITVRTFTGSVIIPMNEDISVQKDGQVVAVESIEVGNWATVLGNRTDTGVEPEYVLITEETLQPRNQRIVLGSIFELSSSVLVVTARESGNEVTFSITNQSVFQDTGGEEVSWRDFDADYSVLVVALEDPETEGRFVISTVRSLAALDDLTEDATDE